jgi:hypothetical protein
MVFVEGVEVLWNGRRLMVPDISFGRSHDIGAHQAGPREERKKQNYFKPAKSGWTVILERRRKDTTERR